MKKFAYLGWFILLVFCTTSVPKKENLTDIESLQQKTSFIDLKNEKINLKLFKGKKIIISHWATWCSPCIKEMPSLIEAQEILKNFNYVFLLVSDEKISKIHEFKNDTKFDFNFLKSTKSNEVIGVYSLPTSYIFDEEGMKVRTIIGTIPWSSKHTIQKLKNL